MQTPEELSQEGIELCEAGNFKVGIAKMQQGLEANPHPIIKMMLNNNIALALLNLAGWEEGKSPVKEYNVAYLDEALAKFTEVCRIYNQEIEGASEEEEFIGLIRPRIIMKNALNFGLAIGIKLDKFRSSGIFEHEKRGKSGCFIATAALGNPLAEEVLVLSNFRDEYLARGSWGRKFISFYYHVSPSIAFHITGKKPLCWWSAQLSSTRLSS